MKNGPGRRLRYGTRNTKCTGYMYVMYVCTTCMYVWYMYMCTHVRLIVHTGTTNSDLPVYTHT